MIPSPRSTVASMLLVLAPMLMAGCGGDDDPGPSDPETTGDLTVTVTADGSGLAGVAVALSGTASANQTTGSNGSATFNDLEPGGYDVAITVPDGHVLDTGEEDSQSVTVTAGETATASFALLEEQEEGVQEIDLLGQSFSPSNVTVAVGTVVRWVNGSVEVHNVTPNGNTEWTATTLNPDGEFEHTFDTAGSFDYECTLHSGMTGTVTVN